MTGVQGETSGSGSTQWRILLRLSLCHCFLFVVGMSQMFATRIMNAASVLLILGACSLSFVCLLTIPYNLHILELTLQRLTHGLAVEPISLRWRWSLSPVFTLVNELVVVALLVLISALNRASKLNIVTLRRESARSKRVALWRMLNLDLFFALILLVGYVAFVYFWPSLTATTAQINPVT